MARPQSRTQHCNRSDALNRLKQAESFVEVAELILANDTDTTNSGVAAALAVLSGIAASDAACCAKLGLRARSESHDEAKTVLETVAPHGPEMAKDLNRLLSRKNDSHYGISFVAAGDAIRMVGWANRLLKKARAAVEA